MSQDTLVELKEDFALFCEAGFIAVKQLDEKNAVNLFKAAEALNSESMVPKIGFGYIELQKLQIQEALKYFREVLEKEPENHVARILMGMCYLFDVSKRDEGKKIIKESMEKTTDSSAKELGEVMLRWAEVVGNKSYPGVPPIK